MVASTLGELLRDDIEAVARRYVGLAAGAVVGDDVATHGAGRAAPAAGPPHARTLFPIASITKVVTALALADAVTRGDLTLDTPLADVLPEVPLHRSGRPITLGHLASHTAGLPAMPRRLFLQGIRHRDDPHGSFTRADLRAALATTRLRRAPGGRPRYSNFGVALLGEALSRHEGLPYGQLIAQRVTGPLGMTDAVARRPDGLSERTATGHSRRGRPLPTWTLDGMAGAGALWSTVADLLTLSRAHLRPDTCALPEAVRLVQQPWTSPARLQMGLGWHLSPIPRTRHRGLWHGGRIGGFASFVVLVPQVGVGLVVLANSARGVERATLDLLPRLVRLAGSDRACAG